MSSKNLRLKEKNVEGDDFVRTSFLQEIVETLCWPRCMKAFCETALLAGEAEILSLSSLTLPIINPLPLLGLKDGTP